MSGVTRTRPIGMALRAAVAAVAIAVVLPCGVAATAPGEGLSSSTLDALRSALGAYEEVRADLAADRWEEVPAGASRLAEAFRAALVGDAAGAAKDLVEEAAGIAESMAEAPDLAAARLEFGEVSRRILQLAGHDGRLAEGWQVFTCPMAKGFPKWIQPEGELDNPYMGTSMPRCGGASDWSLPDAPPVGEAQTPDPAAPEPGAPVFEPGIPGLSMVDVRDHKFLWREIDELQAWERGNRITVADYRNKVVEKTAHYLGLTGEAAGELAAAAAAAVDTLRGSMSAPARLPQETPPYGAEVSGVPERLSDSLGAAVASVGAVLDDRPRHQLFAPEVRKWVLRLAFGPSEAKEAREARQAGSSPAVEDAGALRPERR